MGGPEILGSVADARDLASTYHFSQSNPAGPGQGDVPALLRRVADTVEGLGDVEVMDITFQSVPTADENDLTMTVYYHRPPGRSALDRALADAAEEETL